MNKVIVTIRSAPAASVEIPEGIERSCFGALRLFPGIPRGIARAELDYIMAERPDVAARVDVRPYVESKRVDRRGAGEADVAALAEKEGVGHLAFRRQVEVLRERGKIRKPAPSKPAPRKAAPRDAPRKTNGRVPGKK